MNVSRICRLGYKYVTDSNYRFLVNAGLGAYRHWADEPYLKKMFRATMGKELDLNDPKTFNEKLQWLKLYNRKPEYTMMVDKYLVRDYIKETLGEQYLIPLLGVWDDPDEIDFDALPDRFVLKCNHNSGKGMYICKDKSKMDVKKVKSELRAGLKQNYYLHGREWPYKDVPRKIIAEQYMEDAKTEELRDYKFFCFNGEVKAMFIAMDRQTLGEEVKFDFFVMAHDTEEANRAEFKRVCEGVRIAKILGAPVMRHDVFSQWSKKYKNFDAALEAMVPNIRAITSYAKELGVKTMMENHGFICQDADRVERIINTVNDDNFGLLLDMGNFMCADEQSALSVSRCAHLAFHVHAKDFYYRPYETETAEGYFRTRAGNQIKGSVIGEGVVPVEQCLHILKSKGYDGVCAIEYEGSDDCIEGITKGFHNLKKFIENVK